MTLPRIISSGDELRSLLWTQRRENVRSGLVPTMGALHEGHLSLVRAARKRCGFVVVTLFVNPTQFGAGEDLDKYPRTFDEDCRLLRALDVDVVFAPSVAEMYPEGYSTYVEPPAVSRRWEGAYRPEHFRGVATVVLKLIQLAPADWTFFGQKDYQQVLVVQQMIHDLNVPIQLEMCPIIREADGLAMSSRNRFLDPQQRRRSLALSEALRELADKIVQGEKRIAELEDVMRRRLERDMDAIDYAVIVNAATLEPVNSLQAPWAALIAARIGSTRLIDNLLSTELAD